MSTEEHLYSIALRKCRGIGDTHFKQLVAAIGSAKEVWEYSKNKFEDFPFSNMKALSDIGNQAHLDFAEKELAFCEKQEIKINLLHNGDFPFLLEQCDDAPAIIYQKGIFPDSRKYISMVGTRKITHYGKEFLTNFFAEIKANSFVSVSGLALGTDAKVHEESLKNAIPTIAVLAHGFHTLYPSKNRKLSNEILENGGALLTEFNSSQKPDRENFIQRNRVVAGLTSATIVVESPFAGGSMSTATYANNYNREVYALPGKITDICSQGCNKLIAQNKARTVMSIKSLIKELELDATSQSSYGTLFPEDKVLSQIPIHLKDIYEIIFQNPLITLDDIAIKTNTSSQIASGLLLELELLGLIRSLSGKQYSIK